MNREAANHKNQIIKLLESLSYRHNIWTAFCDFVEISAIAISNAFDIKQKKAREERYLEIIGKYETKEINIFPQILTELTQALDAESTDILGTVFQEMGLNSYCKGQFFTPESVARMMGKLSMDGIHKSIKEKGYASINEPACGAGALVIGMANAMKEEGLNYQELMMVTAIDLDVRAVHMCYIQLSMLGIPAVVIHGDSLTVEAYSYWYTSLYILNQYESQKLAFTKEMLQKIFQIAEVFSEEEFSESEEFLGREGCEKPA